MQPQVAVRLALCGLVPVRCVAKAATAGEQKRTAERQHGQMSGAGCLSEGRGVCLGKNGDSYPWKGPKGGQTTDNDLCYQVWCNLRFRFVRIGRLGGPTDSVTHRVSLRRLPRLFVGSLSRSFSTQLRSQLLASGMLAVGFAIHLKSRGCWGWLFWGG